MTITPTLIVPPAAPTFSAWRVDFDDPGDAMTAMIVAAQLGYQAGASCFPGDPTAPIWQFEFSQPGREPQKAREHDWIVSDGETISCYTPEEFAVTFTADVPLVWPEIVPMVSPLSDGQAQVSVPLPTSPNAPWTWTVSAGTVTATAVNGETATLTVTGLTEGETLTVTATDHYGHTATSGVSNPVTVTP